MFIQGKNNESLMTKRWVSTVSAVCLTVITALITVYLVTPPAASSSSSLNLSLNTVTTKGQNAGVWRFKETQILKKWDNAYVVTENVNEKGGVVELNIGGVDVCQGGVERIRFKWSFGKDISVLRPGDTFDVMVDTRLITVSNPCTGGLAYRTYFSATGSDGLTVPWERGKEPVYDYGRFYTKKTGQVTPDPGAPESYHSATAVIGVDNKPPTEDVKTAMFFINIRGPGAKDKGAPAMKYIYVYEVGGDDGGPGKKGKGGGDAMRACLKDPGAIKTDRQAHYGWASSRSSETIARDLVNKANLLFNCDRLDDNALQRIYADLSVLIAGYLQNPACFGGDRGVVNPNRDAHLNWARGRSRQVLRDNLTWKLTAALKCLDRQRQNDFFADASVIMAGGS